MINFIYIKEGNLLVSKNLMSRLRSYIKLGLLYIAWLPAGCAQNTTGVHVENPIFDQRLSRILKFDVPVISVDSFFREKNNFFILDTRSPEEYKVSHIQDANYLDYSNPDYTLLEDISRATPIVLYCSVGYRSERIGRKIQDMGYTHVYNLYGSIFEWVNEGHPIIDSQGQLTDSVHTYNKQWSQYVNYPGINKTW